MQPNTQSTISQDAPARSSSQLPKYLFRRDKTYYFKRRIPADVAHGFAQFHGQVWKSLDTELLGKAKVFLAVEVSEFERKVANLRCSRALENAKALELNPPATPVASIFARHPKQSDASKENIQPGATVLAQRSKVQTDPIATQVKRVGTVESLSGRSNPAPTAVKSTSPPSAKLVAQTAKTSHTLIAPTMQHLFEDWKQNQTRARSINAVHTVVMEFRTLHGPIAVENLTKQHARAYRDVLIERRLSKSTVENRLGFLSTLMRYGMREMVEHLSLNPFEHIDVTGVNALRQPKDRRAYEVSELNILFPSRLYTDEYRPDGQAVDAAYWAPILGPFLGARIEEICQLRIEDVQRVNGTWCVRVCDLDANQKIKTASSFRRVPLHEVVINTGFLLYVTA
jgi:hypothetical protein